MHQIFNKNIHLHIKVKDKRHPINIGLVLVVVLASVITWFLTEYAVYALDKISNDYSLINEFRPEAKAAGIIYYVKPNGSDSLDGKSEANAWKTINKVNSINFLNGDIIKFEKNGTYSDATLSLAGITSASSKTIKISAYGSGNLPWIGGGVRRSVYIANTGLSVTLEYLRFDGQNYLNSGAWSIAGFDSLKDVTVDHCTLDGSVGPFRQGHAGIWIQKSTGNVVVSNCTVQNTGSPSLWDPVNPQGDDSGKFNGITVAYQNSGSVHIYNNTVHNTNGDALTIFSIIVETIRTKIHDNKIYNANEQCIDMPNAQHWDIYNNWFYRDANFTGSGGIPDYDPQEHHAFIAIHTNAWSRDSEGSSYDINIYENIFGHMPDTTGVGIQMGRSSDPDAYIYDVRLFNNVFDRIPNPIYLAYAGVSTGIEINHNIFLEPPTPSDGTSPIWFRSTSNANVKFAFNSIYAPSWAGSAFLKIYYGTVDYSGNIMYLNKNGAYYISKDAGTLTETLPNVWYNPANSGNRWYDGGDYSTIASWNAKAGIGTDIEDNPDFVNPGNSDLTLQSNSPAIDAVSIDSFTLDGGKEDYGLSPNSVWSFGAFGVAELLQSDYGNLYEAGAFVFGTPAQICSDGTPYEECSKSAEKGAPWYCKNGDFIEKCDPCGCRNNWNCSPAGTYCTAPITGNIYYVDSAITDTRPSSATPDCTNYNTATFVCSGGTASAFKTVADVNAKMATLAAGDAVYFRKGQSWTGTTLTIRGNGTSGSPITIGAFGAGALPRIVINGYGSSAINFSGDSSWIIIKNIRTEYGHDGISSFNYNLSHITIEDCETYWGNYGIRLSCATPTAHGQYIIIQRNKVDLTSQDYPNRDYDVNPISDGISLYGNFDNSEVSQNYVLNSGHGSINIQTPTLGSYINQNGVVRYNYVKTTSSWHAYGVIINGNGVKGYKIYGNKFEDIPNPGLHLSAGTGATAIQPNLIFNNVFINTGTVFNVGCWSHETEDWTYNYFFNNTAYNSSQEFVRMSRNKIDPNPMPGLTHDNRFINNIFLNSVRYGFGIGTDGSATIGANTFINNILYGCLASAAVYDRGTLVSVGNLAVWSNGIDTISNNIYVDPSLNADLEPDNASDPSVGAGSTEILSYPSCSECNTGLSTESTWSSNPRNIHVVMVPRTSAGDALVDIGAYEYGATASPPPPSTQKCLDGTSYGQCVNSTSIKYCDSTGKIINNCEACQNCGANLVCNSITKKCELKKCEDDDVGFHCCDKCAPDTAKTAYNLSCPGQFCCTSCDSDSAEPLLKVGSYKIKVTAKDSKGNPAEDTITINVKAQGSVIARIDNPNDGDSFFTDQTINFFAEANGGTAPYTYSWTSDKQGEFSKNVKSPTVNIGNWAIGTHTITFKATDSKGKFDSAIRTIIIKEKIELEQPPEENQDVYYISESNGNDSNPGRSHAQAWKSLDKIEQGAFSTGAKILLFCGDRWNNNEGDWDGGWDGINVKWQNATIGAYYLDNGVEREVNGTSRKCPSTLPTIDGNVINHVLKVYKPIFTFGAGSNGLKIQDIKLQNNPIGIMVNDTSSNGTIQRCSFYNIGYGPIILETDQNDGWTISYNTINHHNMAHCPTEENPNGSGQYAGAITIRHADDCLVTHNSLGEGCGEGIDFWKGADNNEAAYNLVYDHANTGIYVSCSANAYVHHNFVMNTTDSAWRYTNKRGHGLGLGAEGDNEGYIDSSGSVFSYNVVVGTFGGFYTSDTFNDNDRSTSMNYVYNNLFIDNEYNYWLWGSDDGELDITFKNNLSVINNTVNCDHVPANNFLTNRSYIFAGNGWASTLAERNTSITNPHKNTANDIMGEAAIVKPKPCLDGWYQCANISAIHPGDGAHTSNSAFINNAQVITGHNLGLNPISSWPDSVTTSDQASNGSGWDWGAYVYISGAQADTTPPAVNSFSLTSGSAIISWSVSDTGGSYLDRIEVWRAPDNNGSPGTWQRQDSLTQTLTSQNINSHTGTKIDNPSAGTYWYGIHVFDKAGNCITEENKTCTAKQSNGQASKGPQKIVIIDNATGAYSQLWGKAGELWDPKGRLPDYSYAGYHAGEKPIPNIPVVRNVKTDYGAKGDGITDDTQAFKNAIEKMPAGALLIPKGKYVIKEVIIIPRSNIVLRGEGSGENETVIYFPQGLWSLIGNNDPNLKNIFWFSNGGMFWIGEYHEGSPYWVNWRGAELAAVSGAASRGDTCIKVSSTNNIQSGSMVLLTLADPGDKSLGYTILNGIDPVDGMKYIEWPVKVISVNSQTKSVCFKQPLRLPIELKWKPKLFRFSPLVQEFGMENLRVQFPDKKTSYSGWVDGNNGIFMHNVYNSWIKNVVIQNYDNALTLRLAKNVTLENIKLIGHSDENLAFNEGMGVNVSAHHGISFDYWAVDNLLTDFYIDKKHHHEITIGNIANGNVSRKGSGYDIDFDGHRNGPFENLFSDIRAGIGEYVFASSGGPQYGEPHVGVRNTFWNITTSSASPEYNIKCPYLANYGSILTNVITCSQNRLTNNEWYEKLNDYVLPRDLYESQFKKRTGQAPLY